MKKIFLSLALSIFLFFIGGQNSFAANDDLEQLEQDVDDLAYHIAQSATDKQCIGMYGHKLQFWFRSEYIDIKTEIIGDLELRVSKCYSSRVSRIDSIIQTEIIDRFSTSTLACSTQGYGAIHTELMDIMDRRSKIFATMSEDPKYAKETCKGDSGAYTFSETKKAFEKLKANWKNISKALESLSGQNTKTDLWKKYSWKSNQEKINKRAEERAQKFVTDFNNSFNLGGLLTTKSGILPELQGLSDGKTITNEKQNAITQEHIAEEAKKLKQTEYEKYMKMSESQKSSVLFLETKRQEDLEKNIREMETKFMYDAQKQEKQTRFDNALSMAIISSLDPFHETLLETTQHLKENQKALEAVLNRQNIQVGY